MSTHSAESSNLNPSAKLSADADIPHHAAPLPQMNMPNAQSAQPTPTVMMVSQPVQKDMAMGLVLTFLLGPLGMFYATTWGAIIMLIIDAIVGLFTFGFGLIFMWPIQLIWVGLAIKNHNQAQAGNMVTAQ